MHTSPDISRTESLFGLRLRFGPMFAGRSVVSGPRVAADSVSITARPSPGSGRGYIFSDQVQFASVQKFPLHFLSRLESDGRSQGNRKIDVEFWLLSLGADGLHF